MAMLAGLLISVGFLRFGLVCEQVRDDTLRLHIVANSDLPEDQSLKLMVRDAVLAETEVLFANAPDKASALQTAEEHRDAFEKAAEKAMKAAGRNQRVEVKTVRMHFAPTDYERFSLPPGEYDAIRIELGEAKGHNWFCVLYPGLCVPAAQKAEYPDEEENRVVTGNFTVGFALLEWLEQHR